VAAAVIPAQAGIQNVRGFKPLDSGSSPRFARNERHCGMGPVFFVITWLLAAIKAIIVAESVLSGNAQVTLWYSVDG